MVLTAGAAQAAPLSAVSYISYNSQRANAVSTLLEQHSIEILKKHGFETIDQGLVSREIEKNSCLEETCQLRFAANAQIELMINGSVEDRGDYISITLRSYGTGEPLNGRQVMSKTVQIPLRTGLNAREFSLICEEHAALFIASTLRSFTCAIPLLKKEKGYSADSPVTGSYNVYYRDSSGVTKKSGKCSINKGSVETHEGSIVPGSFIFADFLSQSHDITDYYSARKHEIVFYKPNYYDTLFIVLTTPIASATMPFAAPVLGYYTFGDWSGLGLWALNAWPYLYLEAKGFIDSPENLRHEKEDITRDDKAASFFAWYMLLAGGMPLFMDAYAHQYLSDASLFIGQQRFLGSDATACYLSLVSNGGGQFYKGHRGWGYFYFHLNNALLYMTIRELSVPEHYDHSSDKYIKGGSNTGRARIYGTVLALSKIIEITHTLLSDTDLECGETVDEYFIPQPIFTFDSTGSPVYGISLTFRY